MLEAIARDEAVYLAEGEKDVHALERAGVVATCNPMGAGKWRDEYSEALTGAEVVIVSDRDEEGRAHARQVAASLSGSAAAVRVVEPAAGKDASDHLAAGRALDEFLPRAEGGGMTDTPKDAPMADTAELLDELRAFVERFAVLPSDAVADLIALWIAHTHAIEAFFATPYVRIVSAAPDSGKSLLLEVLAAVCRRGWYAVNPSVAVLYRKVDRDCPTLLLDEIDLYPMDERRDALSVLNSGYKRGARVDRCTERGELVSFSAFCPKAYAGLDRRALAATLLSRSITVRMVPRTAAETVDAWIAPLVEPEAAALRERCAAWAEQHVEALRAARPDLLGLLNRRAETWWALLAIAEHAGEDWAARARAAARELVAGGDAADQVPDQVQLLLDVRDAFGDEATISTADLLAHLNSLDESPWGARRRSEGLDARGLARMLRPFKIRPRTIGSGTDSAKGYRWDQFADAFTRHLPQPSQASQASHRSPGAERGATDATDATDKSPHPRPARDRNGRAVDPGSHELPPSTFPCEPPARIEGQLSFADQGETR